MSANELLHEIEALPDEERVWLVEKLLQMATKDETAWSTFSASQLIHHYAPEDSVYDEE
jgi:hypothetical protein